MTSRLSLLIPTKNRTAYLKKLLTYYAGLKVTYPILIGDASEGSEKEAMETLLKEFERKLNLSYFYYSTKPDYPPSKGTTEAVAGLAEKVRTPYVAWNADDDYFVPSSLEKCVNFLETHSDYSLAHGEACLVSVIGTEITGTAQYPQRAIENESASERVVQNLERYAPTEFSVKRTSQFKENWREAFNRNLFGSIEEVMISTLSLIDGKSKKIHGLTMVRQAHSSMTSKKLYTVFDWICSPVFSRESNEFMTCASMKLSKVEGITPEAAKDVLRKAFWGYIANGLWTKRKYLYGPKKIKPAWKKQLSGVATQVKSYLPKTQHQFLLPALLRPSSKYHKEFMPVYQSIRGAQ